MVHNVFTSPMDELTKIPQIPNLCSGVRCKSKESPKSSDLIDRTQNIEPEEFAIQVQGMKSIEATLMWHHYHAKSQQPSLKKITPPPSLTN